jgi:hypothetical protein
MRSGFAAAATGRYPADPRRGTCGATKPRGVVGGAGASGAAVLDDLRARRWRCYEARSVELGARNTAVARQGRGHSPLFRGRRQRGRHAYSAACGAARWGA